MREDPGKEKETAVRVREKETRLGRRLARENAT